MKILIAVASLDIGGGQAVALRLAKKLEEMGHDIAVYDHRPKLLDKAFVQGIYPDVKILSVNERSLWVLLTKAIGKFLKLIGIKNELVVDTFRSKFRRTAKQYDVIHSHLRVSDRFVFQALKDVKNRPRLVLSMHGCYEDRIAVTSAEANKFMNEGILNMFDVVTYLTNKNLEFVNGLELKNPPLFKKVYNVFDLAGNKPTSRKLGDTVKIGMVARGIEKKGWAEAIEIILGLRSKHPNIELHLVGDSDHVQSLKRIHHEKDFIKFHGHLSKPMDLMKEFDIGILPSYFKAESLPTVLIEFMSLGIPAVASDLGETRNILNSEGIEAGKAIALKNERPDVESFIDCLVHIIGSPSFYQTMSNNCSVLIKKFDPMETTKTYLGLYE